MKPDTFAIIDSQFVIAWDDLQTRLDGRQLRARCRCAECRALALRGIDIEVADDIVVDALSPLGYGVQLHFSDGHNRGVFPWNYLRELALAHSQKNDRNG